MSIMTDCQMNYINYLILGKIKCFLSIYSLFEILSLVFEPRKIVGFNSPTGLKINETAREPTPVQKVITKLSSQASYAIN